MGAWLSQTDTVTSRRVIVRRGFFVRHRSEASLGRIREVRSRRSVMQRMFGSGTVVLVVGTGRPLELVDVPAMERVVDAMHELIERSYALDQGTPLATSSLGVYGAAPGDSVAQGQFQREIDRATAQVNDTHRIG